MSVPRNRKEDGGYRSLQGERNESYCVISNYYRMIKMVWRFVDRCIVMLNVFNETEIYT